ncbi:hypothetical protein ZIOFF_004803 [Zingiber officinale]|uniref:Uncharacterized protein n=1 Tax=Zingiber officinale TaxID=94328 RepID=A0A8J5HLM2_ZINOF|nr:hypothetical protein ZIOFF_004803 [Zingiber officinale]
MNLGHKRGQFVVASALLGVGRGRHLGIGGGLRRSEERRRQQNEPEAINARVKPETAREIDRDFREVAAAAAVMKVLVGSPGTWNGLLLCVFAGTSIEVMEFALEFSNYTAL